MPLLRSGARRRRRLRSIGEAGPSKVVVPVRQLPPGMNGGGRGRCICKGTVPIPGAKDLGQVNENLGAMGWRLDAGEVAELDAVAAAVPKSSRMTQNIFQTK